MKSSTGLIVSLKYAPGHLTSVASFDAQTERVLRRPNRYLLSQRYRWMLNEEQSAKTIFSGTSDSPASMVADCFAFLLFGWALLLFKLRKSNFDIVYFANPHPLNPAVAMLLKLKNPGCRVLVHLHEPEPDTGSRSRVRRAYEVIIDLVQIASLKLADDVIVSSDNAHRVLSRRKLVPESKIHLVPLLFDDFRFDHRAPRTFITYIGHVSQRRGIDTFLNFAVYCHEHSIDLEFQIISKDSLEPFLEKIPVEVRRRLKLINKPQISNQEIAEGLARSIACCVLYKSVMMQSGVIPVALRSGTPVIVTNVGGLAEFLQDGQTGFILEPTAGPNELHHATTSILRDFDRMSHCSRNTFQQVFHEDNWARYFEWLVSAGDVRSTMVAAD